ncbi:hypothetical protein [Amycolatopsis thermoflava]|uniref:hypothetical protein n=1 Tax=Amycolatopsis thermoflava TaxID=84480 RepID=UPI003D71EBD8
MPELLAAGLDVRVPAVPNRSLSGDAAAGVDEDLARVLAVSQRPPAAAAFGEPASAAAWRTRPSWGVVSTLDRTINPDVERFGYQRAGTTTV